MAGLFVVWLAVLAVPVSTGALRLLAVALPVVAWLDALWLMRRKRGPLLATLLAPGLLVSLLLEGHAPEVDELRHAYLEELKGYEGTPYRWGGENGFGIDCSGLVRKALVRAEVKVGIKHANPALLRQALHLWFFDASARALSEGGALTREVQAATSLRDADYSRLLPGDLMVTTSGVHTMAYLGERVWIGADPGAGRVLRIPAASSNEWLSVPVRVMRWQVLDAAQR